MRRARLASGSAHKARELRALMPGWEIEPLDMAEAPDEDGETYEENARLKARHGRAFAPRDVWVIGEDSGLEVDGLGGRPGVHSARYAPEGAPAIEKLLRELGGVEGPGRRGRYTSVLVAISPAGEEIAGVGLLEGSVAREARGSEGFGYDPVFVPEGEARTVAELGDEWKACRSHRARAARALLELLEARGA